jgi:RimJ/RimL family protein N-acetyltransferase
MTLSPAPALTGVPVLETERLILRAPELGDFDTMAEFAQSDRSRFVGGPGPRGLTWRAFCAITGHWVMRGFSMFVFADKSTGKPLGASGPWFPEGWPEPEIGWSIWAAQAEGKGLAFEAATATRAFAYDVLGWPTAISLIHVDNTRSAALARRMGCTPDGIFVHQQFGESTIWRHPAPDALADGGMGAYA